MEYTSQELCDIADSAPVPKTDMEFWEEECERLYHKAVAKIQTETRDEILRVEELVPGLLKSPDVVPLVTAEFVSPMHQCADDLAKHRMVDEAEQYLAKLEFEAEDRIEAERKLLAHRLTMASAVLGRQR